MPHLCHCLPPQSSKTAAREAATKQLRALTNATAADATRLLKASGWRIDAAIDAFYADADAGRRAEAAQGDSKEEKEKRRRLEKVFEEYAGECAGAETLPACSGVGKSRAAPAVRTRRRSCIAAQLGTCCLHGSV